MSDDAGDERVRAAIEAAEPIDPDAPGDTGRTPEPCPVRPLGQNDGAYSYLSPAGDLRTLRYNEHTKAGIASLFGERIDYLSLRWPRYAKSDAPQRRKIGWDEVAAREWLFGESHKFGFLEPNRAVRGPGVWTNGQAGLIVHCGDFILVPATSRESSEFVAPAGDTGAGADLPHIPGYRWMKAGLVMDGAVYPAGPPVQRPSDTAATDEEIRQLLDFLGNWAWLRPKLDPRLLLGWIGCALVVGALRWRPHVLVTGAAGTGKTTLEKLVDDLLGWIALSVSAPTEAGIRQLLAGAARPIIIDEMETENAEQARRVIGLMRLASTGSRSAVVRGSAEGRATQWPIRASFFVSSILHVDFKQQDRSRICRLELGNLPGGEEADGRTPAVKRLPAYP